MTAAVFRRAARRILNRLGQDAFLRSAPCGKVNIERAVDYAGYESNVARYRGDLTEPADIATILKVWVKPDGTTAVNAPVTGDRIDTPDGAFTLDRLIEDNGQTMRYIVREA
jgi:hypothetical protein